MTIILECQTEKQKYRWILRQGERARIGKSEWMEFSLPKESSLSDEHFALELNAGDELVIASSGKNCSITPTDSHSSWIDSQQPFSLASAALLYAPSSANS